MTKGEKTGRPAHVLVCRCTQYQLLERRLPGLRRALAAAGAVVEEVDDLCLLAAKGDKRLRRLAQSDGLRIAACRPRSVRWLMHRAGAPLDDKTPIADLRREGIRAALDKLVGIGTAGNSPRRGTLSAGTATNSGRCGTLAGGTRKPGWIAWYPVIDYSRCRNCKQCVGFCLFGVYSAAGGTARVVQPAQCKTDCPACARVCPAGAIIFPKYKSGPISGEEPRRAAVRREKMQTDQASVLAGDVYAVLRARGRKPSPAERKRIRAEAERHVFSK